MDNRAFFRWLVNYHIHANIPASLQSSKAYSAHDRVTDLEGVVTGKDGMPIPEGVEVPSYYPGLLVMTDGVKSLKGLLEKGWVPDDEDGEYEGFTPVRTMQDFFQYLRRKKEEHEGAEGTAYVFNAEAQVIMCVPEFRNFPKKPPYRRIVDKVHYLLGKKVAKLRDAVPEDFITLDGSIPVTSKTLGTKTRVAIRHTRADPDVNAFQIRRTVKGDFGVGPVTWFDHEGLKEEVYFDIRDNAAVYLDAGRKLVGVHRSYRDQDGKPFRNEQGKLIPFVETYLGKDEFNAQDSLKIGYSRRVA